MTVDEPYAAYLAPHLAPGERLLAACATRLPLGTTFSGSQTTGWWRHVENILDTVAPGTVLDWLLFGRAASGSWDSTAAKLTFARSKDAPFDGLIAVTDRRLLWCGLTSRPLGHWTYRGFGAMPVPDDLVRIIFETGRETVVGARVGRHRLISGRLWVRFVDGSWVGFVGGKACHQRIAALLGD